MAPDLKTAILNVLLILEVVVIVSANSVLETEQNNYSVENTDARVSRVQRMWQVVPTVAVIAGTLCWLKTINMMTESETGRGMMNYDYHDVEEPKAQKPWLGYYDFLITEGSYKFWVVFQLFTIAVLIYSAFAAIYYAKYTINDYENYDDYLFGRSARSVTSVPPSQTAFLGLPVETYLRIFNAIANYGNK